jgi:hypothetical protein
VEARVLPKQRVRESCDERLGAGGQA